VAALRQGIADECSALLDAVEPVTRRLQAPVSDDDVATTLGLARSEVQRRLAFLRAEKWETLQKQRPPRGTSNRVRANFTVTTWSACSGISSRWTQT